MNNKQEILLRNLSSYNLTDITHHFDKNIINSLYHGEPILWLFLKNTIHLLNQNKPSYFNKFLTIYHQLLELGANPNLASENNGNTVLHYFLENDQPLLFEFKNLIFKKLIETCDINKLNHSSLSPFANSLKHSQTDFAKNIMQNEKFLPSSHDVIHSIMFSSDREILSTLLNQDFEYSNIKNQEKTNLLQLAVKYNNDFAIDELILKNINPFIKDWNNKNTVDYINEFNNQNPHLKKYVEFHKLNNSLSLKQNKEKHLKI